MESFLEHSRVRDADGALKILFRGDYRGDAVAQGFSIKEDADRGSGGIYFTDNPSVASAYAASKEYHLEDPWDVVRYTSVVTKSGLREPLSTIDQKLTPSQRQAITDTILKLSEGDRGYEPSGEDPVIGGPTWTEFLRRSRNRHMMAAADCLFLSGLLDQDEFLRFLDQTGLFTRITFDDPRAPHPTVTPVYLDIRNPLVVSEVSLDLVDRIEAITGPGDASVEGLRLSRAHPEFPETITLVTEPFRRAVIALGHDGIRDTGGLVTEQEIHEVWIALDPAQIVSAYSPEAVRYRAEDAFAPSAEAPLPPADVSGMAMR